MARNGLYCCRSANIDNACLDLSQEGFDLVVITAPSNQVRNAMKYAKREVTHHTLPAFP